MQAKSVVFGALIGLFAFTGGSVVISRSYAGQPLHIAPQGKDYKVAALGSDQFTVVATNADLRQVLADLFKAAKKSYSLSPNVRGDVTLNVSKTDFDTALRTILTQTNCSSRFDADIVIVEHDDQQQQANNGPVLSGNMVVDKGSIFVSQGGLLYKVRKADMHLEGQVELHQ